MQSTLAELSKVVKQRIASHYPEQEAEAITKQLLQARLGLKPYQLVLGGRNPIRPEEDMQVMADVRALEQGKPLQYILGEADFCNLRLQVNASVLIPRPETEELVQWVLETLADAADTKRPSILDVGTGSGCIALALADALQNKAFIRALDLREDTLAVARDNAQRLGLEVAFQLLDLTQATDAHFGNLHVLVSNPPYVPQQEAASLARHVREHEPHQALFVPDEDPLLFYRLLLERGRAWLQPGGWFLAELHMDQAHAVEALCRNLGYKQVTLRKDLSGRHRMVRAQWLGA